MKGESIVSIRVFIEYEVGSSWWASWLRWEWARELAGMYFAWKTARKYSRYLQHKLKEQER